MTLQTFTGDTGEVPISQPLNSPLPVYPDDEFTDITSALNDVNRSGKHRGAMAMASGPAWGDLPIILIALGSAPDAIWANVEGGNLLTPV